jgi:hypothetical protein
MPRSINGQATPRVQGQFRLQQRAGKQRPPPGEDLGVSVARIGVKMGPVVIQVASRGLADEQVERR